MNMGMMPQMPQMPQMQQMPQMMPSNFGMGPSSPMTIGEDSMGMPQGIEMPPQQLYATPPQSIPQQLNPAQVPMPQPTPAMIHGTPQMNHMENMPNLPAFQTGGKKTKKKNFF
jgi:hypothetical protein